MKSLFPTGALNSKAATEGARNLAELSAGESQETRIVVSARSRRLRDIVEQAALDAHVPRRALQLKALMHLPRIARADGTVGEHEVAMEISTLADRLPSIAAWQRYGASIETTLQGLKDWRFDVVPETQAKEISERFHYIGFHRPGGNYYGLYSDATHLLPTVLVVSSAFDVDSLRPLLREDLNSDLVRVVSRVFAFRGAPGNAISYMLARVARRERQSEGAQMLLTYVNPNLGFTGASYRASGWKVLGAEPGTTYQYVDSRYMTDRALVAKFGTCDYRRLAHCLGQRYARSQMALAPLLVFSRVLTRARVPPVT